MPPAKKYPCLICSTEVGGKAGGVQCSYCDRWVHPKCANITKAHFELYKQPTCQYICETCVKISTKIKKEIQHLQVKQMEMHEDIEANKEEIATQKRRMDKVEKKVDELDPAKIIEQSRDSMLRELRERESRKDNLVVYQVEETEVGSGLEKKEQDILKIQEIFEFLQCPLTREGIKFIFRVGEKKEERPGPRPIILCLKDNGARKIILENTRRLVSSKFERISITPDLTPLQRKEEEELRKEAESRNNSLSEEDRLNYEWVCVGMKGQRSLIKRKKFHRGGEVPRWGRERGQRGREGGPRREPSREPPRAEATARQLAREEGERERERVREAARERQKERNREAELNRIQEAVEEEDEGMYPQAAGNQSKEPTGTMDMEDEDEEENGEVDNQSGMDGEGEEEEEEETDTQTITQSSSNHREQRKRARKETSLSPPIQTQKKKT